MREPIAPTKFQVLLAEDDEVNQDIVRAFLAGGDLQLTIAADGRQALEMALLRKFDLLIVDQNMPYITGDRVIRHLRAGQSLNATTPVIRFTAEADFLPRDVKTTSGGREITLPKPLSKATLVSTVRSLLGTG